MLLSTSFSTSEDGNGSAAVPTTERAVPYTESDRKRGQAQQGEQKRGHIILAPRTGSGVGIGPGFTSEDLAGAAGVRYVRVPG